MDMSVDFLKNVGAGVVAAFRTGGVPLTDGIVKVASENQLNAEQTARLVETVNQLAYLSGPHNSMDKTAEFPLADYRTTSAPEYMERIPRKLSPVDECAELADEEPDCASGWELAGRLAAKMLPQVFRIDSPVLEVRLAINHQRTLEGLINSLAPAVFQAQDSLGWCYQFWQTKRKEEVNKSGVPIGADELSPVTQLFTEPYMVSFLLDNALGAWWAQRRLTQDHLRHASSEQELRERAAIDGVPLTYLRFVKVSAEQGELWQPAGGWYDAWASEISELKALDPCCGSGHFLVALFLMLVPMRMHLDGIDASTAIERVLQQNLYGLELDGRCIEIAAFALALEAWRFPNAGEIGRASCRERVSSPV